MKKVILTGIITVLVSIGYGQEIADGLIDYGLDDLALDSVTAHAVKDNLASVKILDRSRLAFVAEFENEENDRIERQYRLFLPGS